MNTPTGTGSGSASETIGRREQIELGRAARKDCPRSSHARFEPAANRDPLGIIRRQNLDRLPELVPLRVERMLSNPFAFYRGSAALQVADLAAGAVTGLHVTICGDAHLANFGMFASPQRTMVFDLNDFDEAAYGPWEWDVKRLVTSVVIAAQHRGFNAAQCRQAALVSARAYREGLRRMLRVDVLRRYYIAADVDRARNVANKSTRKFIDKTLKAGRKRTSRRVVEKVTRRDADGRLVFVEDPPTLTHVPQITEATIREVYARYRETVSPDISLLLSQFQVRAVVRRVVGVGSVGTRCYIAALEGPHREPLVLQIKEAGQSVVTEFGQMPTALSPDLGPRAMSTEPGLRVTASQRILQAVSDPFLGYVSVDGRAYYLRQFRDYNISLEVAAMNQEQFTAYARTCGTTLARAHVQSPRAAFISGYLGGSDVFDRAVVDWAFSYAGQSLADFQLLHRAQQAGELAAEPSP